MKEITMSDMHINNIKKWKLNDSVKQKVEEMSFGFLVMLREKLLNIEKDLSLPLNFVSALVSTYNVEDSCFTFGNGADKFHLDFGLDDILYLTGLPINGMPVSGMIHEDNVQLLETHLALSKPVAEDFLTINSKQGMTSGVDLRKLLAHFHKPEIIDEVDVGILAKAFIFYGLGYVLLPIWTSVGQPHYLPLLGEEIKKYAWGAAVLAHIKGDLDDIVRSQAKSSISCFSLALTIFALERFPILTRELVLDLPTKVPLSLGWIDMIVNHFRPKSSKRKSYAELEGNFNNMSVEEINWMPYNRVKVSRDFEDQLRLRYVVAPCINFYSAYMVRPDICYRQLGLAQEEVKSIEIPNKLLLKPSALKGIDLRSYVGGETGPKKKKVYTYPQLHEMWANRFTQSIIALPDEVLKYLLLFFFFKI
ncbi:putative protein-serine/threonine phosphatase [Medicago truncatula]|uniref:Aminotransferase-like plant mobile domain-containing protein n=1 Tax=Medicago truncatula TaxID=3880 RepID=A0A396HET3_MEDTR|nr:putative protein-serine/threonine phosphatase [Medicago truncatula]